MRKLTNYLNAVLAALSIPILLVVLLALPLIVSCSEEDVPEHIQLYDIRIDTQRVVTVYNYLGGVEDISHSSSSREYKRKTSKELNEIKKLYPSGTFETTNENSQRSTVTVKTVRHTVTKSK